MFLLVFISNYGVILEISFIAIDSNFPQFEQKTREILHKFSKNSIQNVIKGNVINLIFREQLCVIRTLHTFPGEI